MADELLPTGIGAKYCGIRLLGRGSFGRVVLAQDSVLRRPVAVKVLETRITSPDLLARFEREARVTANLRHPNIVTVFDFGVDELGTAWIVYEMVEGVDLDRVVDGRRPASDGEVLEWAAAVAEALQVAHDAGIVHRDVKPANVLLRDGNHPLLCDFGIAHADERGKTLLTQEGMVMGTLAYMAPEVFQGAAAAPASDQYSWAATVFEMLYHELVYPVRSTAELIETMTRGTPPAIPAGFRGRLPGVEDVLLRALARDPGARFPAMRDFAAALNEAVGLMSYSQLKADLGVGPRKDRADPGTLVLTKAPGAAPSGAPGLDPPTRAAQGRSGAFAPAESAPADLSRNEDPVPLVVPARPTGPLLGLALAGFVAVGFVLGPVSGSERGNVPGAVSETRPGIGEAVATPIPEASRGGAMEYSRSSFGPLQEAYRKLRAEHEVQDLTDAFSFHPSERSDRHEAHALQNLEMFELPRMDAWIAFLEALQDWFVDLDDYDKRPAVERGDPSWRDAEVVRRLDEIVFGWLVHALEDYQVLFQHWSFEKAFQGRKDVLGAVEGVGMFATRTAQFQAIFAPFRRRLREFSRSPSGARTWIALVGLIQALVDFGKAGDGGVLADLRKAAAEVEPGPLAFWIHKAILYLLATSPGPGMVAGPMRDGILAEVEERVVRDWPVGQPWRAMILRRCLLEEIRLQRIAETGEVDLAAVMPRVSALLDRIVAEDPEGLEDRGLFLEVACRQAARAGGPFYTADSPTRLLAPVHRRLDALRDKAKAAQRAGKRDR